MKNKGNQLFIKAAIAILALLCIYCYLSLREKSYAIHVDGETEYRRYEYDCDSIVKGFAYRDGVKLKLAGKTEHFFNEHK